MKNVRIEGTMAFRLSSLGAVVTDQFAGRIEPLGLKPRHADLMAAVAGGTPRSQQDLARTMGVAPSLIVALADQLEDLKALHRVRDPHDRRRQVLKLTRKGRTLLAACTAHARAVDAELTARLVPLERDMLHHVLGTLAPGSASA
ncbi:MarR family winged helix-turn-helix transcriptional regulator [Longispora sp. K20-0274]|uniref:MarR family winged helix-turn-helix transcriptional regulator n=1 Tax=Longispora sp. K20-0274 TaxID=3088255 RepID=UPI00399A2253